MRSTKKQQKRQRTVQIGIAVFLALLMLTSIAGYFATPSSNAEGSQGTVFDTGKEFNVVQQDGVTRLIGKFDDQEYSFSYLPSQAAEVSGLNTTAVAPLLANQNYALTFTFDQNNSQLLDYARYVLMTQVPLELQPIISGIAEEHEQYNALPIVTCETQQQTTIHLSIGNTSTAVLNGTCIKVTEMVPSEMIAAIDAIRYAQLGVYT